MFLFLQATQQGFECMNVAFDKIKNQMDKIEAILINLPRFIIKRGKRNLGLTIKNLV
jgi:hypothetical protein